MSTLPKIQSFSIRMRLASLALRLIALGAVIGVSGIFIPLSGGCPQAFDVGMWIAAVGAIVFVALD